MIVKRKAAIIDIDGVLAYDPKAQKLTTSDWEKLDKDAYYESRKSIPTNKWCYELVLSLAKQGYDILYVTGRNDGVKSKSTTEKWLAANSPVKYYHLFMRTETDNRIDHEVKKDIYLSHIIHKWNVLLAIDDMKPICDMWKALGIPSLHCGD